MRDIIIESKNCEEPLNHCEISTLNIVNIFTYCKTNNIKLTIIGQVQPPTVQTIQSAGSMFPIASRRRLLCHCSRRQDIIHATSMLAASPTRGSANAAPLQIWSTGEPAGSKSLPLFVRLWKIFGFFFVTSHYVQS